MTLDNDKAHELFNAARNLPPAEREPFLDKECCIGNASLREEVESLLRHTPTSASTVNPVYRATVPSLDFKRGDRLGNFKILSILGEGGMGTVYLAEQTFPVVRKVALKIIKAGKDTKDTIARFEAERQALAMMSHPGIANVFEAGATDAGRPYFVLEYIKGLPITEACDERKLNTKQRLELLVKVCDAVQHAHNKAIIHRDLKPSNILVVVSDNGELVPKIIDFGLAKAMSGKLTDKTLVTEVGHFLGTSAYMSPEQADLNEFDIDTRTDIYALGVITYELLVGLPPFDTKQLHYAGIEKRREIICTHLTPRPSTRLSSIDDEEAVAIAVDRQTKIDDLVGVLRKELEWIPLKALRKLPQERYKTAEGMGQDIRRYLNGEPLEAGPESKQYRLKKALARHKGLLASTAVIILVIIAGAIITAISAIRVSELSVHLKAKSAELANAEYLVENKEKEMEVATVLLVNSQEATEKAKKAHGQALAVQNSLNYKSEQEQAQLLASNTEVEMLLAEQRRLKSLYAIVFIKDQQSVAQEQYDRYYQVDDSAFMSPAQAELLEKHYVSRLNFVMYKWGYTSQVHVRNNEEFLRRAQSNLERVEANPSRYQNEIVDKENQVRAAQVDVAIARKDTLFYFQTVLDLKRALFSDNNAETIKSMRELGELYTEFNEFEDAEKLLDKSLVLNIKLHGGKHLNTSDSFTALADLFQSQDAFETAAQFNLEALKIKQEFLNKSNVSLFESLSWQTDFLIKSGSYESAERYARDSLDSALIIYTKNHLKTAAEYYKYALVLHNLDRYPEAEKNYIEALDIEWNRNNDSTDYFMIMQHFADLYDEWDKPLKYDLLRTAHDGREKLSPELLEQMLNQ